MSIRRSRGLDVTIASTRPWETTECISLPRPVSDRNSITSVSRQRAPLTRYSPSPARLSLRTIEISPAGRSTAPLALSSRTSTSASERACTPCAPAKITSCIDWPRTASGDCSPSAHNTASVTLDLPEPFGPTITDTPGENSRRVRSGKDLKPFSVSDLRCTSGPHGVQRCLGGRLLRVLLRAPGAPGDLLAADHRGHLEDPLVRRTVLGRHAIGHQRAPARQPLLQRRLEVRRRAERLLDLRLERLDHGLGGLLVAEGQVAGPD